MSGVVDGGSAFPTQTTRSDDGMEWVETTDGMTLRDYFAAKAMQGWLASFPSDSDFVHEAGVASLAYRIADAMLAARGAE